MQRKTCKASGCFNSVWAKGYCPRHQYLRTDKKPKQLSNGGGLKSKSTLKTKKPLRSKKPWNYTRKPTGELALFNAIWEERPHVSFIESGANLEQYVNTDMFVNMFAHVLPKKDYPAFRLERFNIVLLAPIEHAMFDQGTEQERKNYAAITGANWSKLYDLKKQLLEMDVQKKIIPKFE